MPGIHTLGTLHPISLLLEPETKEISFYLLAYFLPFEGTLGGKLYRIALPIHFE